MEDIFIKNIKINKVRHLENIEIQLDDQERKHLILTGKNGSGKTSVLEVIRNNLGLGIFDRLADYINQLARYQTQIKRINDTLISNQEDVILLESKSRIENSISQLKKRIDDIKSGIDLTLINADTKDKWHSMGEFICAFFDAKRITDIKIPDGIKKLSLKDIYDVNEKSNSFFVQYIVNLKADKSFAEEANDYEAAEKIERWFNNFETSLRQVFNDSKLKLQFDRLSYNYNIVFGNGNTVNFNQLPDGYSAIMTILTELILRMEKRSSLNYEIQGIVLIDEIESHLHIELQKRILPFLTSFFPNIQFIVTTHSPFVISSDKNSIVFDLEKQIKLEDATGYSYDTLIESYLDSDKYSLYLKKRIAEYEKLLTQKELAQNEKVRKEELMQYFNQLPTLFAPELAVKIQQFKLNDLIQPQ